MIVLVISFSPVLSGENDTGGQDSVVWFKDFKPEHEQKLWVFLARDVDA